MSLLHPVNESWADSTEIVPRAWFQPVQPEKPPTAVADMVSAFFRNKRQILIALGVFLLCVLAFSLFSSRTYESQLTYLVRSEGAAFPITSFDGQGAPASMVPDMVAETQIGTEAELISDTELHRKVLAAMHPELSAADVASRLNAFDKHLKVLPVPKTTLIAVKFTGTSREQAITALTLLNQQYLASRAAIHGSEKAFAFFDSEANRYYRQLQLDQNALARFEQGNNVTLLDEEKDLATRRLSETRALLNDNESGRAESVRKLTKMSTERDSLPGRIETQRRELPDQVSEGHLSTLLVDLQNKRQELLTKYHASDRHVQEVDQQIQNTLQGLEKARGSVATEVQSDVNPIRASVDSDFEHLKIQVVGLDARQKSLQHQVNDYQAELQKLNRITGQHDDLVRSIKQDEANYELYSKRREEARIDKTLDGNRIANVSLVAGPAIVPEAISQRVMAIGSICVIGTIVIIGVGVLCGLWSPRFYAPWEVEAAAGVPVLATIPAIAAIASETAQKESVPTQRNKDVFDQPVRKDLGLPSVSGGYGASALQTRAVSALHPALVSKQPVPFDEAYGGLIRKLRRTDTSRSGGSVFVVASSVSGEGVSHVVHGLSEELKQLSGKRVAVVNAPEGYANPLAYTVSLFGEQEGAFQESGEESLRIWLRRLRETHDYVLIDCPALQTSRAALALGRESDGVLLVVGAGDATRIQLRGSMTALTLAAIPLVGIALNKRTYPIPDCIYKVL